MDLITAIQKQIDATSPIMERLVCLRPAPTRGYPGSGGVTSGKKRYDKTTISLIEEEIDKWQLNTRAVLAACFAGNNENKNAYERTIVSNRMYYDAKEELEREVKDGRNVLSAIIQEESLKKDIKITESVNSIKNTTKKPLVFISHAGADAAIIREFMDCILKDGIGLDNDNIACTSFEWTTVEIGDNIPDYIKQRIGQANVVLAMVSQAYKSSEVCQNEVGAAWALNNRPLNIVLPDVDFNELGWLFNLDKAIRIDNIDSLNKLQLTLCNRLGLAPKVALDWTPCVTKFLSSLTKLLASKQQNVVVNSQTKKASDSDSQEKLNHDRKLFEIFDNLFPEDIFKNSLHQIQTSTHYSDYESSIWYDIIHWLEKVSNRFLDLDVQDASENLLKSFKELTLFTLQYYSADRISWSTENDHGVSPEKWREIHEAKIYSWEPDMIGDDLYQKRERIIMEELPQKVTKIEQSYNDFRIIVKSQLYV